MPVRPLISTALVNSLKLALVAFILVVPLSIFAGVFSALRYGRPTDRIISVVGLSMSSVPEFVWGVVLILIFTPITLGWLPLASTVPPGSSEFAVWGHLFLPALPLVFVLFGYIMRIARAGTIEALDADYTRTAYLKGLTRNVVIRRHVLRNSLLPTITVVATQVGYLVGGLAIVETLFNYPGIGYLILQAAKNKDFPLLESAVLTIGLVYSRGDDHRRPPVRAAQPAHPGLALVSSPGLPLAAEVPLPAPGPMRVRSDRGDTLRRIFKSKTFIVGSDHPAVLDRRGHLRHALHEERVRQQHGHAPGHVRHALVRHGHAGPRRVRPRDRGFARDHDRRHPRDASSAPSAAPSSGSSPGTSPGTVDNVMSRVMDALLAIPLIILAVTVVAALGVSNVTLIITIGVIFTPLIGRTVRTAVLVERGLDYVQAAKLRGERAPYIMFVEILPNVMAPLLVEATVRLGYSIFFISSLSFLGFGVEPPSPDWGAQVAANYTLISFAWWTVLYPALAIASLVISINLITDGITSVIDG